MSDIERLTARLHRAERRIRALTLLLVILGAAVLTAAVRQQPDVVRARGLVITDQDGRERIVVGAPMGAVSSDSKLRDAIGVAVLDSVGHLHVALGSENPLVLEDGRLGQRISGHAGLTIYDPRTGRERGGMGAFNDGRATVCVDYGTAVKEAGCLFVAPGDQYAAVILNANPREEGFDRVTMVVGADGTGALKAFGGGTEPSGVLITAGNGPARVALYDSAGTVVRDLAVR